MIVNAFRKWKENAGVMIIWGFIAYTAAIILGSITYIILRPIGQTVAGSTATTVLLLTYSIIGTVTAGAIQRGPTTAEEIWEHLNEKWADVGIATVFAWLPFIVGLLISLAAVLYSVNSGSGAWANIGLAVFAMGWFTAMATSVAPYIADTEGWKNAVERTWMVAREKYITLLILALVFGVIYITYLALLPTPLGWILAVLDATLIMHIRNLAFFEVTRSVSARE